MTDGAGHRNDDRTGGGHGAAGFGATERRVRRGRPPAQASGEPGGTVGAALGAAASASSLDTERRTSMMLAAPG